MGVRVTGKWSRNSVPLEGALDLILFSQWRLIDASAFALKKATVGQRMGGDVMPALAAESALSFPTTPA